MNKYDNLMTKIGTEFNIKKEKQRVSMIIKYV